MLVNGLRQPRQSRAYKEACIELQRLSAPVTALLLPALIVALLLAMTGDAARPADMITAFVLPDVDIDNTVLKPLTDNTERKQELDGEVSLDVPQTVVGAVDTPPAQTEFAQTEPLNAVLLNRSPVTFTGLYGKNRSGDQRQILRDKFHGADQTEAAVMRALRWLKRQQQADGSWPRNKVAMTGLAVLTFLAHGEQPGASPEFGETVQRGIEYLLRVQNAKTGILPPGNYEHPIATYALCEAYGMTRNPNVKAAAEKALAPIIRGQHPTGGWTYHMNPGLDKESGRYRDDTSYMGWCVQALKTAKLAGLQVEGLDKAMKLAVSGFKRNAHPDGGFGYTGPGKGGLTGVGTLCLQLLGAASAPEAKKSMDLMSAWAPVFNPDDARKEDERRFAGGSAQYYFYYVTQCKFHEGGKVWEAWNADMQTRYVKAQRIEAGAVTDHEGQPCDIGWWENGDAHTDRPVMDTCLAALQLMVYYRSLQTTSVAAVKPEAEILAAAVETGDVPVHIENL
ncbi:MAG: terpene cyclase/mutase family protein, partial [Kiritimatiellae bacterium]|nr:terpene cyclase/mutase family protein [Kiritimatiellia bacterium]MDD4442450.1 terpene cyclase/mutase family protein [Kiritimatiellia bacterium]